MRSPLATTSIVYNATHIKIIFIIYHIYIYIYIYIYIDIKYCSCPLFLLHWYILLHVLSLFPFTAFNDTQKSLLLSSISSSVSVSLVGLMRFTN